MRYPHFEDAVVADERTDTAYTLTETPDIDVVVMFAGEGD
jgi:hypothetical protein